MRRSTGIALAVIIVVASVLVALYLAPNDRVFSLAPVNNTPAPTDIPLPTRTPAPTRIPTVYISPTPKPPESFKPGEFKNLDGFAMEYIGKGKLFIRSGGSVILEFKKNGDWYCFGDTCLTYLQEEDILEYSPNPYHK